MASGLRSSRRAVGAKTVFGVYICAGLSECFDDLRMPLGSGVINWRIASKVRRIDVRAFSDQFFNFGEIALLRRLTERRQCGLSNHQRGDHQCGGE
jgi:hypothetical protein